MNRAVALLALALASGCTAPKTEERRRPVRFAVIGAPEVGANDDDLAAAIGKLSRETGLDFVLVAGPLLAKDADAVALELLHNDLGQLAGPVYVSFAAVGSGAPALKADEVLSALEKLGPGDEHAVAYTRSPPRQPDVVVSVAGPDGRSPLAKRPEGKRVVQLGAGGACDVAVVLGERAALDGTRVCVPRLSTAKQYLLVTLYPRRLEVQPVALDGPNPPELSVEIAPTPP